MLPWYKTARRWFQLNFTEDVCLENNLDFWRKYWKSAPYQGVILNCGGVVGFFQSRYPYQKNARWLDDQDIFGMFSDAAHEDGLAVAARFDVQYIDPSYAEDHPDWFFREKDGSLFIKYGQAATCINSEYYQEILPLLIEEVIEKYHPEAFTDNSWKANRKTQICYCENCKRVFKEYCGEDLPQKPDWEDPIYRKWIKWSYQKRVELWDALDAVARRKGGDECMWAGMFHGDPMNRLNEFIDFHEISKRLRFLFLDHQCRDHGNGKDVEQNSMLGSMYRLMSNENLLITECTNHYARFGDCGRWFRQSSSTPVPTLMWEQEGIAGGIAPWVHFFSTQLLDHRREHISEDLLRWHEKNEKYLGNRSEIADLAVLWSQENGDFYGRDKAEEVSIAPWMGIRHTLLNSQMPFLPINVHDIRKYGSRVKSLILPDLAVLSERDAECIIEYLSNGGNLILTGKSGLLDEEGELKEENALWNYLGLEQNDANKSLNPCCSNEISMLEHPICGRFSERTLVYQGCVENVRSRKGMKPVAVSGERGIIYAGITEGGGRCVYIAADFERQYAKFETPMFREILYNAINWTLDDKRVIDIKVNGVLSPKLYRQDNNLILHLNNVTGSDIYGGMANEFIPVGPIEVSISDSLHVTDISLTVAKRKIPFTNNDGHINFSIDEIVSHEMVVIEGKNDD